MTWNIRKYKREIAALRASREREGELHPLRQEQIKTALMSHIGSETKQAPMRITWQERKKNIMQAIISSLVGLSVLGGTAFASTGSVPGDVLYPVKQLTEKVELSLAANDAARAEVRAKHAAKRLDELTRVEVKGDGSTTQASVKTDAEVQAEAGVTAALKALADVHAKLEAEHNTEAAAAVADQLLKLEQKAEVEHGLIITLPKVKVDLESDANVESGAHNSKPNIVPPVESKADTNVESSTNRDDGSVNLNLDASSQTKVKIK